MAITPLMPVYPRSPVRPVRGEGVYLYGEKGEISDVAHASMELPPDTAQMLSRLAAGLAEAREPRRQSAI